MNDLDDPTLTGWLRTLGGERLRQLFAARPDGTRAPAPLTLGELADRLQRTGSVVQLLDRLPLPCLQAAQAQRPVESRAAHARADRAALPHGGVDRAGGAARCELRTGGGERPSEEPSPDAAGRELAERLLASPDRRPHPAPFRGGPAYDSDTEEILDGNSQTLSLTDIRQFAHAIHEAKPLTIEYVSASGVRTIRTVSGIVLDPPHIVAHCHLRDAERVFTISRIHDVLPA